MRRSRPRPKAARAHPRTRTRTRTRTRSHARTHTHARTRTRTHHGEALEAEAEGPAGVLAEAAVLQDALAHDAAAEHLEPGVVEPDLQLRRRTTARYARHGRRAHAHAL